MNEKPLVTIVTPSYNQGQFIEDTILSVKNQDYPNIEHIIVDGGSADNTLEILRKYEGIYNMRWISEPDEGQSDAYNKGYRMAGGEIIAWLNSDDVYFDRQVISHIVEQFKSHQDAGVIYGDNVIINENNLVLRFRKHLPSVDYGRLLRRCLVLHPATFVKRKMLRSFIFNKIYHYAMDYDLWLYLKKNNVNFRYSKKIVVADRLHSAAKRRVSRPKQQKEVEEIQKKYGQTFGIKYRVLKFFDSCLLTFYRFKALFHLFRVYSDKNRDCFAFKPKFKPLIQMILNQLLRRGI